MPDASRRINSARSKGRSIAFQRAGIDIIAPSGYCFRAFRRADLIFSLRARYKSG
jgi:hypothetical protein